MSRMKRKLNAPQAQPTTTAPVQAPPRVLESEIVPEFIRLPKPGRLCPRTGLTRSALNELVLPTVRNEYRPPVKSFCLRQRGARKGIRLVDYASLRGYILANAQAAGAA